ncbi:hypothetical protein BS50DRAFT_334037 [Corynespora cassiicola Philippines]|uniref:Uncharacterized protein n=1 Tax=Corynespora cassiicola Philippines TaxID=1448308 RepID=A0A2T2NUR5_CORCC|nr:hypothetical protein BS50DRAFT_334037 [Corynespora cassiicola Philippines]
MVISGVKSLVLGHLLHFQSTYTHRHTDTHLVAFMAGYVFFPGSSFEALFGFLCGEGGRKEGVVSLPTLVGCIQLLLFSTASYGHCARIVMEGQAWDRAFRNPSGSGLAFAGTPQIGSGGPHQ